MRIRAGVRSGAVARHRDRVAHHRQHRRTGRGARPGSRRRTCVTNCRMMARRHVLDAVHHLQREPPERRPDDDAAGHGEEERRRHRRRRRTRWRPRRRPPGDRSAARWRRSAGFRLRESSGCDAAAAAGGARPSPPRRRAARRWRRARSPAPRACPASACAHDGDRHRRQSDGEDDQAGDRRPVVPEVRSEAS